MLFYLDFDLKCSIVREMPLIITNGRSSIGVPVIHVLILCVGALNLMNIDTNSSTGEIQQSKCEDVYIC